MWEATCQYVPHEQNASAFQRCSCLCHWLVCVSALKYFLCARLSSVILPIAKTLLRSFGCKLWSHSTLFCFTAVSGITHSQYSCATDVVTHAFWVPWTRWITGLTWTPSSQWTRWVPLTPWSPWHPWIVFHGFFGFHGFHGIQGYPGIHGVHGFHGFLRIYGYHGIHGILFLSL